MMTRKPYPDGVFDKVLLMIIAYALTMFAKAKRMVVVNIGLTRTSFHFLSRMFSSVRIQQRNDW
jgi:hypothetical protein